MNYIILFSETTLKDIYRVGGKNASLGEMIQRLTDTGIKVPLGFAVTVQAYWDHLEQSQLLPQMKRIAESLPKDASIKQIQEIGTQIRALIYEAPLPSTLVDQITAAYAQLSSMYNQSDLDVAVRSSATAEDLPQASFAGQQETFLNVKGIDKVLDTTKKCMASLFTERAIVYRTEHGFDHFQVGISVGIQKMVRSDKASSGVVFSLDTDTGFKNVAVVTSSYGLGENIVKGVVNPDEFHVHKPTLALGFRPIVKKYCGSKEFKLVYAENKKQSVENLPVPIDQQRHFSLTDDEILTLARQAVLIENHYSTLHNAWRPMDIEWAKDGIDNELYIIQARPETVFGWKEWTDELITYKLKEKPAKTLITGLSIGQKIAHGRARRLESIQELTEFNEGDILVTSMTDPDWVPIMKKAAAIITDQGGRTCHAAIVSRELGIPATIGTMDATKTIIDGDLITVDCSQGATGFIYEGIHDYTITKTELKTLPKPRVPLLVNIADPDRAYKVSFLPVSGVGLARIEFIISGSIRVHPMAVCREEEISDPRTKKAIHTLSAAYKNPKTFFVETLAQGIGMIAAAFYPREVLVRLSDFKSNEYADLLGGKDFEPVEENPMLGFRGAVRYCDPSFAQAFELECQAIKKARNDMGFSNIKLLIPFVRSLYEAECTIATLEQQGLKRGVNGLQILMMCEIPSNVILLEEFSRYFDGFSIGSNDLTQFTLAVDRDAAHLTTLFNENDPAVKKMLKLSLEAAKRVGTYMSICGQAPSDFPEIADFLIENGIDALSLNADSIIPFLLKEESRS